MLTLSFDPHRPSCRRSPRVLSFGLQQFSPCCAPQKFGAVEVRSLNGSFTPETAFVLIFEMGQYLPLDDTDDQTACAYRARRLGGQHHQDRCSASRGRRVPVSGDRLRSYRVGRQPAAGACILSSRAGEFHPQALPETYVNLSIHTAPDVRPLPWHSGQCAKRCGCARRSRSNQSLPPLV